MNGIEVMMRRLLSESEEKQKESRERERQEANQYQNRNSRCGWCGKKERCTEKRLCPAAGLKCLNCEMVGHFQRVCRNKTVVREVPEARTNKVQVMKVPIGTLDDNEPVPKVRNHSNLWSSLTKVQPSQ